MAFPAKLSLKNSWEEKRETKQYADNLLHQQTVDTLISYKAIEVEELSDKANQMKIKISEKDEQMKQ